MVTPTGVIVATKEKSSPQQCFMEQNPSNDDSNQNLWLPVTILRKGYWQLKIESIDAEQC